MERVLCTFSNSNSAWADRHCSSPAEQDTHNVFDHSDDNNNNNNNHGDADDGDAHDTTKDPRNSTEEEDEETEETRAPTPGPVFLDDENNNNNGTGNNDLPLCQSNQAGEFWVSQEAKRNTARTKIVSFAYQVQGTIDLNVDLLRTIVLPQLERELATALIPELFAPQQCQLTMAQLQQQQQQLATFAREEKVQQSSSLTSSQSLTIYGFEAMESDNVDPDGNNNLIRGRHRRQLTSFANGPADAPVTGMQPIPDDVLLPNYEGGAFGNDRGRTCALPRATHQKKRITHTFFSLTLSHRRYHCSPVPYRIGRPSRTMLYSDGSLFPVRTPGCGMGRTCRPTSHGTCPQSTSCIGRCTSARKARAVFGCGITGGTTVVV